MNLDSGRGGVEVFEINRRGEIFAIITNSGFNGGDNIGGGFLFL